MTWAVIHFEPKPDADDEQEGAWVVDYVGTQVGARQMLAELLEARGEEIDPILFKDRF